MGGNSCKLYEKYKKAKAEAYDTISELQKERPASKEELDKKLRTLMDFNKITEDVVQMISDKIGEKMSSEERAEIMALQSGVLGAQREYRRDLQKLLESLSAAT